MTSRYTLALGLLLALITPTCSQEIDKPALYNDGLPFGDYTDNLLSVAATWKPVGAPDMCIERAREITGCTADTIEAREVTYADCSEQPWILCRCAGAVMSMDTITSRFGYVPPGIRSYVGGLLVSPEQGASAFTYGDFVTFNGPCVVPVFIHESGHSVDQGVSGEDGMIAAVNASSCVADDYAKSNYAENFAQVIVVDTYRSKKGSLPGDPSCMQPQLDFVAKDPRISEAQQATKCNALHRPFMQKGSPTRPVIGTAGSSEAGAPLPPDDTTTGPTLSSIQTTGTDTVTQSIGPQSTTPIAGGAPTTSDAPTTSGAPDDAALHSGPALDVVLSLFAATLFGRLLL